MINICSNNLPDSKEFYTKLFDFQVDFDSDWFVHLVSENKQLEIGIIERSNAIVPEEYQNLPQGFYVTFVVDSADESYKLALNEGYEIVQKPTDTFYGQRRLLLKDPNGTLVDISSLISNV